MSEKRGLSSSPHRNLPFFNKGKTWNDHLSIQQTSLVLMNEWGNQTDTVLAPTEAHHPGEEDGPMHRVTRKKKKKAVFHEKTSKT